MQRKGEKLRGIRTIATGRLFLRIYEMSSCRTSLVPLTFFVFRATTPFRVFSLSHRVAFIRHTSIFHVPSASRLCPVSSATAIFRRLLRRLPWVSRSLSLFALSHVSLSSRPLTSHATLGSYKNTLTCRD